MLQPGEVFPSVLWNLLLLVAGCAEEQGTVTHGSILSPCSTHKAQGQAGLINILPNLGPQASDLTSSAGKVSVLPGTDMNPGHEGSGSPSSGSSCSCPWIPTFPKHTHSPLSGWVGTF